MKSKRTCTMCRMRRMIVFQDTFNTVTKMFLQPKENNTVDVKLCAGCLEITFKAIIGNLTTTQLANQVNYMAGYGNGKNNTSSNNH